MIRTYRLTRGLSGAVALIANYLSMICDWRRVSSGPGLFLAASSLSEGISLGSDSANCQYRRGIHFETLGHSVHSDILGWNHGKLRGRNGLWNHHHPWHAGHDQYAGRHRWRNTRWPKHDRGCHSVRWHVQLFRCGRNRLRNHVHARFRGGHRRYEPQPNTFAVAALDSSHVIASWGESTTYTARAVVCSALTVALTFGTEEVTAPSWYNQPPNPCLSYIDRSRSCRWRLLQPSILSISGVTITVSIMGEPWPLPFINDAIFQFCLLPLDECPALGGPAAPISSTEFMWMDGHFTRPSRRPRRVLCHPVSSTKGSGLRVRPSKYKCFGSDLG